MSTSVETAKRTFPGKRPLYYYVTGRKRLASGKNLSWALRRAIRRGVDFVQIREKDLDDGDLYDLSRLAVRLAAGTPCRVLVNGRADIALAAGAHGVHLPSAGLPIDRLRGWLPRRFIVGVSVHSLAETLRARQAGAHYVLFGHVFPTASKTLYGPPLGVAALRRVCKSAGMPVLALGGISLQNIDSAIHAGAAGVAGISLFQSALDFRGPGNRQSGGRLS